MAHILLVEDNPATSRTIQAMLEGLGHTVATAGDGAQGLRQLNQAPGFDLVLTDIMMPVLDGISLIVQIHKHHPMVPVIAMTARTDSNYLRNAERLGAWATLAKPFTIEELAEQVQGVHPGA